MDFYRPPTLQGALDALGSVNRALRAWKFYPPGHPTRKKNIRQAHAAMLELLDGNTLSLNCGRTDFSFPDGESLKDSTRMSSGLSYELFIRRVQKITFLADLRQEDLLDLIRLLTVPPEVVQKAGGIDKLMADHGIRTIWANEFDLSIIHAKRQHIEFSGSNPLGLDEIEEKHEPVSTPVPEEQFTFEVIASPAEQLQHLLRELASTTDENVYLMLVRRAIACSDDLKARREFPTLEPLVELLAQHASNHTRDENLRERARFGLEQLVMGEEFLTFLLGRLEQPDRLSHEAALAVVKVAGQTAILMTVEKMGSTENLAVRKRLSTLLIGLGETAVPAILRMLDDKRWYVVRNLTVILGEIGSRDAVSGLKGCIFHPDLRVCKDAVRALAKIGGNQAEAAIIEILHGNDHSLFPQAVTSLGGMKSRKSLNDLMKIVCRKDPLLKSLPLKIDALNAIALIGDRQMVPVLAVFLEKHHFLVPRRWLQLKVAITGCLARLGDVRALPVLTKKASESGELGRACAEAVEIIERLGGEQHGIT